MNSGYVGYLSRVFGNLGLSALKACLFLIFIIFFSGCATIPSLPNGTEFRSSDGSNMAYVENNMVIVNGNKSKHLYDGIYTCGVKFSPDAQRAAYIGHKKGDFYLVVDDVEYGPYDDIGKEGMFYDPSGNSVVLSVVQGKKWSVVINGRKGKDYDGIGNGSPVFSVDGKHMAYVAKKKGKWLVVQDGVESKKYSATLKGSPFYTSTGELVYGSLSDKQWRVHVGNWVSKDYDRIINPGIILSPDRVGVAFVADNYKGKEFAVVAGKQEKEHEKILLFQKITRDEELLRKKLTAANIVSFLGAVTVGSPMTTYTTAPMPLKVEHFPSIIFSANSQHYTYLAIDDERKRIIVDGAEIKEIPKESSVERLGFSEDSKSLIYKLQGDECEKIIALQNPD